MRLLSVLSAFVMTLVFSSAQAAPEKVDFAKDVAPIFAKKCFGCHGEKKGKAKLRLHNAGAIGGGKGKKAIVAGKPDESDVVARIILSRDHDDAMPPEDEGEAVTKEEVEIIRRWIAEGATYPAGAEAPKKKAIGSPLTDADKKKLEEIRKAGARAMKLAQDVNWVAVSFRPAASKTGDDQVKLVSGVANIAELNLAGTTITDAGLASLSGLTNLTRLHLERTALTGSGLASLKGLSQLEYLNLYGTKVDDAALAHLEGLTSLKRLYLWQTNVTDAGVDSLKKAIPGIYVNRGIDPPAKPHPGSESKPSGNAGAAPKKAVKPPPPPKPAPKKVNPNAILAQGSDGWTFAPAGTVKDDAWKKADFDDKKWEKGKLPIGYGEPIVAQKGGTELKHKGQGIVLRKIFDAPAKKLKGAKRILLRVASDNSAIVWINGKEVDKDDADHEFAYWNRERKLNPKFVKKGKNVITVLLNNNDGSSDAVIDVELEVLKK